jgi:hypothetical protein
MKTMLMLRAAAMVLTLGIGSAHAGESDGQFAPTLFSAIQAQQQAAPARVVGAQNGGAAVHAYVAHSQSQGTWLFPPSQGGNG